MPARTRRKTSTVNRMAAELAVAVPQVMAHRLARMALSGTQLSPRDREEFTRMVHEKHQAFAQASLAMATAAWRTQQTLAAAALRAMWMPWLARAATPQSLAAQWQSAALGIYGKGLAPVHRTATANAKRLARVPLR